MGNHFRYMDRVVAITCLTWSSIVLIACSPQPSTESVHHSQLLAPCAGFAETGKPPLVYGAQCGQLLVKENPQDPQSRDIPLNILRLPAISSVAKQDPVFLIQGGPGGSSVDMASGLHGAFADIRKNRDLVFVDQRGTGKSNPLNCKAVENAEQLPEAEQTARKLELMRQCAEDYRAAIPFYTTPYAVEDLEQVRRALGYTQLNLWGGSYGSRVVLEYLRTHPEAVRTAILDGVAPVQIALPKHFRADAMAALNAVNRSCLDNAECAATYGDIVVKAHEVLDRLAADEARGNPLQVNYEHPRYRQPDQLMLTAKNFSSLLFMSLYSRDLSVLLPRAITDAQQEDYRLLAALYSLASEQTSFTGISEGMRYTVVCNEDAHFITQADQANAEPFFALNMLDEFAQICAFWPKAPLPDAYFAPVTANTPALLLAGGQDPVTPRVWAEKVAEGLPNARVLEAPGGNHIISTEGCMPQLLAQFIEQGTAEGLNSQCVAQIKPFSPVLGASAKPAPSASTGAEAPLGVQP